MRRKLTVFIIKCQARFERLNFYRASSKGNHTTSHQSEMITKALCLQGKDGMMQMEEILLWILTRLSQ